MLTEVEDLKSSSCFNKITTLATAAKSMSKVLELDIKPVDTKSAKEHYSL